MSGLAELSAAVRAGELSARDLVAAAYEKIERHNGLINAVVSQRPVEEALAEADTIHDGPLAGLPLLVKDTEDAAGLPTSHGSLLYAGAAPAAADSSAVARLRAAGAIVIGKTNVPEFAFEGFTSNRVFGATADPWAPDWSPGGSSGGAGAALISGMAAIATATDGGGSVRIPASFCGLVGLKPTQGMIGRTPAPSWMDMSTHGPLAVSIADVRLLLNVMRGPAAGDPTAPAAWVAREDAWPVRALAAPRFVDWGPLPEGVGASFDTAVEAFAAATGLTVEPIPPLWPADGPNNPDDDWVTIACVEELTHLGRESIEREKEKLSSNFAGAMKHALRLSLEDYVTAKRRRFEYTRELDDLLGTDAILLTPTMCVEGFWADGRTPGREHPGTDSEAYNTQVTNITSHPSLSVPAGLSANGVPFGLQITGPRWADDMVLAAGAAWEAAQPWPSSAPGYEPFYGPRL